MRRSRDTEWDIDAPVHLIGHRGRGARWLDEIDLNIGRRRRKRRTDRTCTIGEGGGREPLLIRRYLRRAAVSEIGPLDGDIDIIVSDILERGRRVI